MSDETEHKVNHIGPAETVPVYDCPVLVSRVDGKYVARSASLAGVSGEGATERAALQQIVAAFKAEVKKHPQGGTIPFLQPQLQPSANEEVRLLAVHL